MRYDHHVVCWMYYMGAVQAGLIKKDNLKNQARTDPLHRIFTL